MSFVGFFSYKNWGWLLVGFWSDVYRWDNGWNKRRMRYFKRQGTWRKGFPWHSLKFSLKNQGAWKLSWWWFEKSWNLLRTVEMRIFEFSMGICSVVSWWWNQIHKVCTILEAQSLHMLIMISVVLAPKLYVLLISMHPSPLAWTLSQAGGIFPKTPTKKCVPTLGFVWFYRVFQGSLETHDSYDACITQDLSEVFNTDEVRKLVVIFGAPIIVAFSTGEEWNHLASKCLESPKRVIPSKILWVGFFHQNSWDLGIFDIFAFLSDQLKPGLGDSSNARVLYSALAMGRGSQWSLKLSNIQLYRGSRGMGRAVRGSHQFRLMILQVEFFQLFNMGYQNYSQGEWQVARRMLLGVSAYSRPTAWWPSRMGDFQIYGVKSMVVWWCWLSWATS